MNHLLILLCTCMFVSCDIKSKYRNNISGSLGTPKQSVSYEIIKSEDMVADKIDNNESCELCFILDDEIPVKSASEKSFKWYYTIPFIGLAILSFLVYRLKKQNMKSL